MFVTLRLLSAVIKCYQLMLPLQYPCANSTVLFIVWSVIVCLKINGIIVIWFLLWLFLSPYRLSCHWMVGSRKNFGLVYGHVMIFVYLLSMYTGYFQVEGTYKTALWLDFVFTIVQLLGGIVLVYGVKYKTTWLVLLSSVVGMTLIGEDVVGDILLYLSFSSSPSPIIIVSAALLISFIGIRTYMTLAVFLYYQELKKELELKFKILHLVPNLVHDIGYSPLSV